MNTGSLSESNGTGGAAGPAHDAAQQALARRRAEEGLQKSEERYRSLFGAMDEGFFLCEVLFDQTGSPVDIYYLEANPAATRMVGQDYTGRRLKEINPGYEAYWYDIFGRVAQTGQAERLEQYSGPDKKWFTFYVFQVGGENSHQIAVIFKDITGRKRQEDNLALLADVADEMSRLSTVEEIIETAGAIIAAHMKLAAVNFLDIDDAGGLIHVNHGWAQPNLPSVLGPHRMEDFLNEEWRQGNRAGEMTIIGDTQSDPRTNAASYAALRIGAFVNVPFSRAGEWKFILSVYDTEAREWRDDEIELFRELSNRIFPRLERARAEELLRQSEVKYRTLFNSIDEGYYLLEVIFDERGAATDVLYLDANPAAIRMSGEDRRGKRLSEVGDCEPYWYELYGRVARTGVSERVEAYSKTAGIWVDTYTFKVGEEGNRVALVFQDVTERKQREANKAFLADFSQSLVLLTNEQEIVESLGEKINSLNGAAVCAFFEINQRKDEANISAEWHLAGGFSLAGEYTVSELVSDEFQRSMIAGEAIVVRSISNDPYAKGKERLASFGIGSFVNVPLVRSGEWKFVLGVYHSEAYDWHEDEINLLTEVANRIWTKLERAHAEAALRAAEEQYRAQLEQEVAQRTAELQQSTALLQSVFDTTLVGKAVLKSVRDENGTIGDFKIELVNKEMQRETKRPDLEGKLVAKEFPGIRQAGLFGLMLRVVESGKPTGKEYHYLYEGVDKWYSSLLVKLDDGLVVTALDITSRKKAEQELLKNFQILRQAEEVSRMGSWEYDMATDSFTWSEGMYRLFHLPAGQPVRPETYLDYALQEDLPVAERIVRGIREGGGPFEETLRIVVNGREVTLRIKANVQGDFLGGTRKVLGVDVDISEVRRLEQENLSMRLQQQQRLLNAILEAQEEERRRISESLHNGVGQILYAAKLSLERVDAAALEPAWAEALRKTEALLTDSIVETRRVSHELVPALLKDFGLQRAIEEFCTRFALSGIVLDCHCFPERLPDLLETAIYRMGQELINNIVRHSGATRANLEVSRDQGLIYLEARDNGKGMDRGRIEDGKNRVGIGLRTIQDRVKLLDGTLEIDSTPGKGTFITICLPLR